MNYVKRTFRSPQSTTLGLLNPPARLDWSIPYKAVAPLAIAIDLLAIILAGILSSLIYRVHLLGEPIHIEQFAGFAAVVAVLFVALAKARNLYSLTELLNFKAQAQKITTLWVVVFVFLTAAAFVMKIGSEFSRGATLSFAALGVALLIGSRVCWRIYLADGLAVRRFSGRKVVVISDEVESYDFVQTLGRHGLQIAAHFALPTDDAVGRSSKDVIANTIATIRGSDIEEIVVSAKLERWANLRSLIAELRVLPLPVNLMPIGPMAELFHLSSHTIGDEVTIELQRGPRTLLERAVKRIIDIVVAVIGLLVFAPLFAIAAIAIKLDSAGPALFRQRRCGFNGRPFQILKFRTMSVMEDGDTIIPAKPNDARVTRVGNWLRRTSIDELPQLLNVLRGEMSIVGPRPHAIAHDDKFESLVGDYPYRQHVKPGVTGWAQVHGQRGEARTVADIERRLKLDLWYIDNWSVMLDLRIMLLTLIEVARGRNAY